MRILITTPGLTFGGAERVLSVLSNQWTEMGHEVCFFITVSKDDPVYSLNESITVCYRDDKNHGTGPRGVIKGVRECAKQFDADIAISFMQDVAALTAIALFGMGIPLVYSERNDPRKTNTRKIDRVYRKIVENRAKYFVFQTEGARNCFKKSVRKKSRVILNPMDTDAFPIHDFNCEKNEIVAVGRLEEQKNYPVLLDAFEKVAREFPDISLSVYGEGRLHGMLENMIEDRGMDGRVILQGAVKDIRSYIKDAKAFVMTSDFEGLPNALMEALAIGLPCVSTDCSPGGARALIDDGVNGYIVACGDSDTVAEKIIRILSGREFAERLGRNALSIRDRVNSKKIAIDWLQILQGICRRNL